ncbi:MAG: type II secretion system protein [Candidatus Woesebacteria bacterium]|nr:MAG: type II secretion system protein [Candidatus Woesebacteria bacterium]
MANDKLQNTNNGFTVVELMLSIGILAILFALTTINLGRLPSSSAQSATIDVLISDIRAQQTQAMAGNIDFGIHFDSTSYTLTPSNFVVDLDPGISFSNVTFLGGDLNFSAGSGETTSGAFSIVNDQINQTTVVNINKYGATY